MGRMLKRAVYKYCVLMPECDALPGGPRSRCRRCQVWGTFPGIFLICLSDYAQEDILMRWQPGSITQKRLCKSKSACLWRKTVNSLWQASILAGFIRNKITPQFSCRCINTRLPNPLSLVIRMRWSCLANKRSFSSGAADKPASLARKISWPSPTRNLMVTC